MHAQHLATDSLLSRLSVWGGRARPIQKFNQNPHNSTRKRHTRRAQTGTRTPASPPSKTSSPPLTRQWSCVRGDQRWERSAYRAIKTCHLFALLTFESFPSGSFVVFLTLPGSHYRRRHTLCARRRANEVLSNTDWTT